jgi:hypothetical protein
MTKIILSSVVVLLLVSCKAAITTTYLVNVSVSGLSGSGLILQNNGGDNLTVSADGTSTFATPLNIGDSYVVTVKSNPWCKNQTCTVTNGSGAGTADVTVSVTCTSPTKTMLMSSNWGSNSLKFTDNIHSLSNGATASPRTVSGGTTTLASMVTQMNSSIDRTRKLVYVVDSNKVKVFDNIDTTTGNVAPSRTITISGAGSLYGVSIDSTNDRMYVATPSQVLIFNYASLVSGTATPTANLAVSARSVFLDEKSDRLYVSDGVSVIKVYDTASGLVTGSSPSRAITLSATSGNLSSLWVDSCNNKLVVSDRDGSTAGNEIAIFNNASTLSGSVSFDSGSAARVNFNLAMNVAVDTNSDIMFAWDDSATSVKLWNNFSTLSGTVGTYNKQINAVVGSGYGMALYNY